MTLIRFFAKRLHLPAAGMLRQASQRRAHSTDHPTAAFSPPPSGGQRHPRAPSFFLRNVLTLFMFWYMWDTSADVNNLVRHNSRLEEQLREMKAELEAAKQLQNARRGYVPSF
jgi:predicted ATP-grasp superfamily ATP-dependent carboligase